MKIVIIGTGYVGLVTGTMLSEFGHQVICIDKDKEKIAKLNNHIIPIYEPELQDYLIKNIKKGNLTFMDKYDDSLKDAEVVYITVDTPPNDDGSVNLDNVKLAVSQLVEYISDYCLIILKSTVPPGTTLEVRNYLQQQGYNLDVASNPEFLREGKAVEDFLNPDRIVVGTFNEVAKEKINTIYEKQIVNGTQIIFTTPTTSELIKYVSNSFLALKIAFINEMSDLCEKVDGDITDLALAVGLDKRIGKEFLQVGPGFGGSCFPKDVNGLLKITEKYQINSLLLPAVLSSNKSRANTMVSKVKSILGSGLQGKKLYILGLTYKADTDDIRESPALAIVKLLLEEKANIVAYDPKGMDNVRKLNWQINMVDNINDGFINAEAVLVLTEWSEFKTINFKEVAPQMVKPIIIDFRNVLSISLLKELGFHHYLLGKNVN